MTGKPKNRGGQAVRAQAQIGAAQHWYSSWLSPSCASALTTGNGLHQLILGRARGAAGLPSRSVSGGGWVPLAGGEFRFRAPGLLGFSMAAGGDVYCDAPPAGGVTLLDGRIPRCPTDASGDLDGHGAQGIGQIARGVCLV